MMYSTCYALTRCVLASLAIVFFVTPSWAYQEPIPAGDPFSILAPVVEEEREAPAMIGPAAGHLSRQSYLERRSEQSNRVLRTRWNIQRSDLDASDTSSEERVVILGDGYAFEPSSDTQTIHDFALERILNRVNSIDGPVMRNTSIAAHVHRQMDVFTGFTHGGELEEIPGPNGMSFERFWIEAATGVHLSPVELVVTETESGETEIRRSPEGSAIFSFQSDDTGNSEDADTFLRWMRHSLPIHPDALDIYAGNAGIPSSFSFLVFSPNSPKGRIETWTRLNADPGNSAFPWPEDVTPATASSYNLPNADDTTLIMAGLAASSHLESAPSESTFLDYADTAQRRADRAGAYLALYQASHHFGACASRTDSDICQRLGHATSAGLGDPQFESIMNTLSAMSTGREAALNGLQSHLHRPGFAGAAANLLAAQALAALRSSGSETHSDLTPSFLFSQSAQADGYAPLTYWHAGRYAASQGHLETAWMLFDLAQVLSVSVVTAPVGEADAMTSQLRSIAPQYFGPESAISD